MATSHTFSSISQTEDGVHLFEEDESEEEDNNGEEAQQEQMEVHPTAVNVQLFDMLLEHEEEITASLELNPIPSTSQLQTTLANIIREKNLVKGESLVMITASLLADTIQRVQVIDVVRNEV